MAQHQGASPIRRREKKHQPLSEWAMKTAGTKRWVGGKRGKVWLILPERGAPSVTARGVRKRKTRCSSGGITRADSLNRGKISGRLVNPKNGRGPKVKEEKTNPQKTGR